MEHPQSCATAAGVTACGTAVMVLLAVRTSGDAYALAGLVGTAMTAGLFLQYVHALMTAHVGSPPTTVTGSRETTGARDDRRATTDSPGLTVDSGEKRDRSPADAARL